MRKAVLTLVALGVILAAAPVAQLKVRATSASIAMRPVAAHAAAPRLLTAGEERAVIEDFCLQCHDDDHEKGGLTLEKFDPGRPEQNPVVAEKMIRKLRARMMPPPGQDRPNQDTVDAFVASLETRLDAEAALHPNPGRRTFQRLNRAEYARSIHALFGLDVDVTAFLPADTLSHNFDNIADVQSMSPTLLEGYLRAAAEISRLAVGDPEAAPGSTIYKLPRLGSQLTHVEGAPFGTRGGISVVHNFPADGDYTFRMMLHSIPTGQLYGSTAKGEQIELSIDGRRVGLFDINPRMSEADPTGMNITSPPIAVKAGPQRVTAAFIQHSEAPVDDLLAPIEQTLADTQIGSANGITTLPHLREFAILGPAHVTGVSDTPSRRRIFTCRPLSSADEIGCATRILSALGTKAYRRPLTQADIDGLLRFYTGARKQGNFEAGIRTAIQAMLVSPHFIFRVEPPPSAVRGAAYRVPDLALASRLSFFLWGAPPDAELLAAAKRGALSTETGLERQARRMLADRRASAIGTRFAAQWLRLQDLDKIHPDPLQYPQFDQTLADAMREETELFFDNLVREDRSALDLLTADYTFVNERLARHYGIPGVVGPEFRRVQLTDENRRGLLGEGSILTMTSVADRTSPVLRGKWVLEVLFGMPPPPPPPNVPPFEDTKGNVGAHLLTVRERMEEHRKNPACRSCHRVIDPIGLALENFDVTGAWRVRDNGSPVDASGQLYDGTPLDGPVALRRALVSHQDVVLRTMTENLMAYALGRRVEYYDMPSIRAIVRDAAAHDNRMSAFILGIVRSPAFRMAATADASTN